MYGLIPASGRRRPRLTRPRLAAAAAACAMLLAGCSGGGAGSQASTQLSLQFPGPPVSLDPAKAGNGGSTVFVSLAYDPLIYLSGNGQLVPDLATKWGFTDAGNKVFELTLRDGVKFSDGSALNAAAAAASMNYFLKAGGGLVGKAGPVAKIEAVAPMRIRITYKAPTPEAATTLTQYNGLGNLIGPKGLADPGSLLTSSDGTGQYIYDGATSVSGNRYVYKKNPHYFQPAAQHFGSAVVRVINNPNAVLSAARTGQVQFAAGSASTAAAAKSAGLKIDAAPFFNWSLNLVDRQGTVAPALADVRVRQAIALAFDRPAIAKAMAGPYAAGSNQVLLPGTDGYDKNIGYGYDVAKAKSLLAAAGYAKGIKLTVLTESLLDVNNTYSQAIANALQAIGIDVTLKVQTTGIAQFAGDALSKKYAAIIFPTAGATMSELDGQIMSGLFNPFNSSDSQLDSILRQAAAATDRQTRTAQYQKASKRLEDLAWTVPIFSTQSIAYSAAGLQNVQLSVLNPNPMPVGPTADLSWRLK
ncbi:ABC transporter substrate-binding protein [Streptomyces sp. HPF1205]|uniref:ABC transporter substrate-binding protein n=1 Tax=Streptomyces sp. HPF1205 TaxID=2873262 RepID=UPI001CEC8F44|nr:ABC transporter substrate-binding protein [Streptomyces sp. HPF1205]